MRILIGQSLDPYFNLASEEYLLDTCTDDVFMLWQNAPSVIIGKNQNAYAEVNVPYTESHHITVVRRLTGGGAVFHDPGNVNFTFITKAPDQPQIDFAAFATPIIEALAEMGVPAELNGRNDITSGGLKISGNAQCVHRRADGTKMLLHHGTLLYDADMSELAGSLRVNKAKLQSKGIKSVTSRVGNIRTIGNLQMTAGDFMQSLARFAEDRFATTAETFTEAETEGITRLRNEKYSTWEWNFGRSPEYGNTKTARFPFGTVTADYTVDHGVITKLSLSGDYFGVEDKAPLEAALTGVRYDTAAITEALADFPVENVISGASAEDIADLLTGNNTTGE